MITYPLKEALTEALRCELLDTTSPFATVNPQYLPTVWAYLELAALPTGSQFFSAASIARHTEMVASDPNIYHFTQSFYARAYMLLQNLPTAPTITSLMRFIKDVHGSRFDIDSVLSEERVAQSVIPVKDLEVVMSGNPWLVVLWALFITGAYSDVRRELKLQTPE